MKNIIKNIFRKSNKVNITELYFEVLKIGAHCPHCVITYAEVKNKLCDLNCYNEKLIDGFLVHWFPQIFDHISCDETVYPECSLEDEKHRQEVCVYKLRPERVLELHKIESTNKAYRNSWLGIGLSTAAILISSGILYFNYSHKPIDHRTEIKQLNSEMKNLSNMLDILKSEPSQSNNHLDNRPSYKLSDKQSEVLRQKPSIPPQIHGNKTSGK